MSLIELARPELHVEPLGTPAGRGDGHSANAPQPECAVADPIRPSLHLPEPEEGLTDAEAAPVPPVTRSTRGGLTPSAPRRKVGRAGVAPTRHGALGSSGDPTPSDPALGVLKTTSCPLDRGDGQSSTATPMRSAVATSPALVAVKPIEPAPAPGVGDPDATPFEPAKRAKRVRGDGQSTREALGSAAVANPSARTTKSAKPKAVVSGQGDGLRSAELQTGSAVAHPSAPATFLVRPDEDPRGRGDGHDYADTQRSSAVATIVDLWRQRVDLRRAEGRLHLQALAVCRRAHDGDKAMAHKAWALIQKGQGTDPALAMVTEPYRGAIAGLDASASALEKQLCKLVRPHPLWTWAKDVRGLGELSIAGLIGESSGNPGDYKSVSAVWKRFGLAVIDGGRQRRVTDADAALRHGFSPQRRAFAYVLSTQLMRSQKEGDLYRSLYDRRKEYELGREIPKAHAHNRALRHIVKELLKHAWVASRSQPSGVRPADLTAGLDVAPAGAVA